MAKKIVNIDSLSEFTIKKIRSGTKSYIKYMNKTKDITNSVVLDVMQLTRGTIR